MSPGPSVCHLPSEWSRMPTHRRPSKSEDTLGGFGATHTRPTEIQPRALRDFPSTVAPPVARPVVQPVAPPDAPPTKARGFRLLQKASRQAIGLVLFTISLGMARWRLTSDLTLFWHPATHHILTSMLASSTAGISTCISGQRPLDQFGWFCLADLDEELFANDPGQHFTSKLNQSSRDLPLFD